MSSILAKKSFHILLGWVVSVVLLYWVFSQLEWGVLVSELKNMNLVVLIPLTLIFVLHLFLRAYRWRFLLPDGDKVSIRVLFDSLMIGNFATFVLPLRAGEFIRPLMLIKESKHSYATAFSSVVIERFFDLSVVLILFAFMTFYVPGLPEWATQGAYALTLLASGILVFVILGILLPKTLLRVSGFFLKPIPEKIRQKILDLIENFLAGAKVLHNLKNLSMTVLLSGLVWLTCYFQFQIGISLFEIEPSYWLGLSIVVVLALAVAAPSAPGFIGVFQTACIAAMAIFGIPKEQALAYSLVMHAHQYLIICLYGIYALSRKHLTLAKLQKEPVPQA
ncbi:MAG: flippase-like domain-containing protein [Deltaproteobacteria bacterium]|nr:flippase-like domain-containing protein [Deltaproteobacteria bacterium]